MQSYRLRVKIKSLATEATIIKTEERRAKRRRIWAETHQAAPALIEGHAAELAGLHRHRVVDVRTESRCSLLAYAFLRGKPYARIEPAGSSKFDHARTAQMVGRFGEPKGLAAALAAVDAWVAAPRPEAPGHTDLMATPESIDAFMEANPLTPDADP